jgi:hypothetical protein
MASSSKYPRRRKGATDDAERIGEKKPDARVVVATLDAISVEVQIIVGL